MLQHTGRRITLPIGAQCVVGPGLCQFWRSGRLRRVSRFGAEIPLLRDELSPRRGDPSNPIDQATAGIGSAMAQEHGPSGVLGGSYHQKDCIM
jgi:hypothetical protein